MNTNKVNRFPLASILLFTLKSNAKAQICVHSMHILYAHIHTFLYIHFEKNHFGILQYIIDLQIAVP